MSTSASLFPLSLLGCALVFLSGSVEQRAAPNKGTDSRDVLVFSKTEGYRHASIPNGIAAFRQLAASHGARLTTTEYEWDWYNRLVGAYFDGHPSVQPGTLTVADSTHPSTEPLPSPWRWTKEWYSFRAMQDDLRVLLTVDEASYTLRDAPSIGASHPVRLAPPDGRGTLLVHGPGPHSGRVSRLHLPNPPVGRGAVGRRGIPVTCSSPVAPKAPAGGPFSPLNRDVA